MNNLPAIDNRLTALEIKTSFADDTLEQLNQIIIRQQQHLDQLQRDVDALRQQLDTSVWHNLKDDAPPHY